jgi:hypothetical protein
VSRAAVASLVHGIVSAPGGFVILGIPCLVAVLLRHRGLV